jgi:hypothetical protein
MNPARTMTCREAAKLLFGGFENQMSPEERARLEAHIAECEACVCVRDQAEFMRRAMQRWRTYRESE